MKKIFIYFVMLAAFTTVQAQVNVGVNEDAVSGSILQLKEIAGVTDSTQNANRGLAMPRVQLSDINNLFPMFLTDPTNPSSGANSNYQTNKATLDKTHTGLVVYNLMNDASLGLSPGLMQWNGSQWVSLSQTSSLGNAIFSPVDCDSITVNGIYGVGVPVGGQNYITVTMQVIKPGAFSIAAQSGNGYSFYLSGMAMEVGPITLNLPSQGVPIAASNPNPDNLSFTGITMKTGCTPTVTVSLSLANFSINCNSITALGSYTKGVALAPGTSNTSVTPNANQLAVTVTASVIGTWYMSTETVNGITFSGSGNFSNTGIQTVYLNGTGTPTSNSSFPVIITANTSEQTMTCSVNITVTAPPLYYAVIADGQTWSYGSTPRLGALNSAANFGQNGVVKVSGGLQMLWEGNQNNITNGGSSSTPFTGATADVIMTTIANPVSGSCPDIIFYFSYPIYPTLQLTQALAAYVQKGGVLIFGSSADSQPDDVNVTDSLLCGIFGYWNGTSPAQMQIAGDLTSNDDYPISNLPNDPIINGPFGNLSGSNYYWAEDGSSVGSVVVTQLPPASVQICSAFNIDGKSTQDPAYSIVWYNTVLNFVFFGDCGGSDMNNTSTSSYPSTFSSTYSPMAKSYGPSGNYLHFIYNSILEMNVVAWAIQQATTNGINPH